MRSSSMILRKCRTENPASSAALGMSRNVLLVVNASVDLISSSLSGDGYASCLPERSVSAIARNINRRLLVGHKGITVVRRGDEVLFNRAGTNPPKQVHHRTGLIIGAA